MITIVDYISANKAKAAAEGALLLLGISGAVWLMATRGWSSITANTVKDKVNLEIPDVAFSVSQEGTVSSVGIDSKQIEDSVEVTKNLAIEKGPDGLATSYVRGAWDLVPVREGLNPRELAVRFNLEAAHANTQLPTEEVTGRVYCWALAKKYGSAQEVVDKEICRWISTEEAKSLDDASSIK